MVEFTFYLNGLHTVIPYVKSKGWNNHSARFFGIIF